MIKWLTAIYILFILVIIFLVDQGYYLEFFQQVHQLPLGDKTGHFVLMGLLSAVINLSLHCRQWHFGKISFLIGSLWVAFAVTLEEFSQMFVPNRTFDWADLMADYLGIFLFGQLVFYLYSRHRSSAQSKI